MQHILTQLQQTTQIRLYNQDSIISTEQYWQETANIQQHSQALLSPTLNYTTPVFPVCQMQQCGMCSYRNRRCLIRTNVMHLFAAFLIPQESSMFISG